MRDDMILGARWESAIWSDVGKELCTGDRGRAEGFEVTMIVEKRRDSRWESQLVKTWRLDLLFQFKPSF